jgi:hypothetical protein
MESHIVVKEDLMKQIMMCNVETKGLLYELKQELKKIEKEIEKLQRPVNIIHRKISVGPITCEEEAFGLLNLSYRD